MEQRRCNNREGIVRVQVRVSEPQWQPIRLLPRTEQDNETHRPFPPPKSSFLSAYELPHCPHVTYEEGCSTAFPPDSACCPSAYNNSEFVVVDQLSARRELDVNKNASIVTVVTERIISNTADANSIVVLLEFIINGCNNF